MDVQGVRQTLQQHMQRKRQGLEMLGATPNLANTNQGSHQTRDPRNPRDVRLAGTEGLYTIWCHVKDIIGPLREM